jgi:N-acetylneuraminic acid mutarotase
MAPMHVARINAGSCCTDYKHLYVFGGRDACTDLCYDSVEKFNLDLNMWNILTIRLPVALTNMFAFPIKTESIIVFGGTLID